MEYLRVSPHVTCTDLPPVKVGGFVCGGALMVLLTNEMYMEPSMTASSMTASLTSMPSTMAPPKMMPTMTLSSSTGPPSLWPCFPHDAWKHSDYVFMYLSYAFQWLSFILSAMTIPMMISNFTDITPRLFNNQRFNNLSLSFITNQSTVYFLVQREYDILIKLSRISWLETPGNEEEYPSREEQEWQPKIKQSMEPSSKLSSNKWKPSWKSSKPSQTSIK